MQLWFPHTALHVAFNKCLLNWKALKIIWENILSFFSSYETAVCKNTPEQSLSTVIFHFGGRTNWVTSGQGSQRIKSQEWGQEQGLSPLQKAPCSLYHPRLSQTAWADPGPSHQRKGLSTILGQDHGLLKKPTNARGTQYTNMYNTPHPRSNPIDAM